MNDACYCSSDGKIYGTSGPYVIQCNGTTGRREDYVRVTSPLGGDMRICYHAANDTLYVATQFQINRQYFGNFFPTNEFPARDIFPVSTALVVGARIGMWSIADNHPPYGGFSTIASSGSYLYVAVSSTASTGNDPGYSVMRFDPTNLADRNAQYSGSARFRPENFALSPTQIALPNPALLANNSQLYFAPILYNLNSDWDNMYVLPNNPTAIEWCPSAPPSGKFFAVCGDTNLLRVETVNPFPGTFDTLNLGAVEATADPCRIRYWSGTGKLYLPCMTSNTVIVWDPVTDTGEAKTGFENPVDVVFTNSKAFAVQNSAIGLREIN